MMKKKLAQATLALAGAGALTVATLSGPANAGPAADGLNVKYNASGTTLVKKTNSELAIAPTTLAVTLDQNSNLKGRMRIKPAVTEFKLLGFVPIKATVNFTQAAPLTGKLSKKTGGGFTASATAHYWLRLSNATAAGIPLPLGDKCQTKTPLDLTAATPEGGSFDLTKGGTLTGTFTIPEFANCNLQELLLNQIVPGPDNTATLNVSKGRIVN